MSRYEERLAVKEALRDPLDLAAPADENEPAGILRRKLAVSFGSRFDQSKGNRGKETIQEVMCTYLVLTSTIILT
jgi:hypothetical protein